MRTFSKPVAWLFGPELIASLKGILLRALYRGFDVRDWMRPSIVERHQLAHDDSQELWFDYLSDTGDGTQETYSVAYLCLAGLSVDAVEPGQPVRVARGDERVDLPRGRFLLVGGDTAYHVANKATVRQRFQQPFAWAWEDLVGRGAARAEDVRPLLGLPGNHDYYDMLDGFNRQFRRPILEDEVTDKKPELTLGAFRRLQEASYAAVELPFGWWLLALDTEKDRLDFRQKTFFRSIVDGTHPAVSAGKPTKLIVATPSPTTVFGRRPGADEPLSAAFAEIGLPRPFLQNPGAGDAIAEGGCRLDLSGDVHHYARYWGTGGTGDGPENPSYASVVSGLGGAFHHPSSTTLGPLEPRAVYPGKDRSRQEIASRLFHPATVLLGGYVNVVAALLTMLLYAAIAQRVSTRWVADKVLEHVPWLPVGAEQLGSHNRARWGLVVYGALVLSSLLVYAAVRWAGAIYDRSRSRDTTPFAYAGSIGLLVAAVAAPCTALVGARNEHTGSVAFDVVLYIVVTLVGLGLPFLAVSVGAKHRSGSVKLGFALLGLWHLFMHAVPIPLLVKVGSFAAYGVMPLAWAAFSVLGLIVGRSDKPHPVRMLALWVLMGVVEVAIPLVLPMPSIHPPPEAPLRAVLLIVAAGIGFLHGCLQFSWYLIVANGFDGHNNEVGGAARIGRFKEFLRLRVRPDSITVHTIAFDDPQADGDDLKAKLQDVFTLTVKSRH